MQKFSIKLAQPKVKLTVRSIENYEFEETASAKDNDEIRKRELQLQAAIEKSLDRIGMQMGKTHDELKSLHNQLVSVAVQFSESLTRSLFTTDVELVEKRLKSSIEAGLSQIEMEFPIVVWVNGDCKTDIENHIADRDLKEIEVREDSRLFPGDCRIENQNGGLIARLEKQLQAARLDVMSHFRKET